MQFRRIRCRGCGRWRSVPWPASELARICPECTRLTEAIRSGNKAAADHVINSGEGRLFRGLRARLAKVLRRLTGDEEKFVWRPR